MFRIITRIVTNGQDQKVKKQHQCCVLKAMCRCVALSPTLWLRPLPWALFPPFSILNADFKLSAVSLHCTRSLYSSFGFFYHFVLFAVKYGIHTRTQITLWIFCKVTRLWRSPAYKIETLGPNNLYIKRNTQHNKTKFPGWYFSSNLEFSLLRRKIEDYPGTDKSICPPA